MRLTDFLVEYREAVEEAKEQRRNQPAPIKFRPKYHR